MSNFQMLHVILRGDKAEYMENFNPTWTNICINLLAISWISLGGFVS